MDGKYDDNENVEFNKSIQDIKKKISENKTYRNYNTFSKIHQLYGRHALNNYNIKFIFDQYLRNFTSKLGTQMLF